MKRQDFEREFLIDLAAHWFVARLQVMGGEPIGIRSISSLGLPFSLQGMTDCAAEMRELCRETRPDVKSGNEDTP